MAIRKFIENDEDAAKGMLDNAPSSSKRAYIKLPDDIPVKFFRPEKNREYKFCFIPWWAGSHNRAYKKDSLANNRFLAVHRQLGPQGEAHLCPQMAFGKPCAICAEFARLKRDQPRDGGKTYWEQVLSPLNPSNRELFLVWDFEAKKEELLLWDESVSLFGDGLRIKVQKNKYRNFCTLRSPGWVVEIKATEKKIGGTGTCVQCEIIDFDERKTPLPKWLIKRDESGEVTGGLITRICVDDWVVATSNDKLQKLLMGTGGADEEEVDPEDPEDEIEEEEVEDKKPVARKPKTPAKPAPEPEEEPEEEEEEEPEEEDEVEEEEEEEVKPVKKKKAK